MDPGVASSGGLRHDGLSNCQMNVAISQLLTFVSYKLLD